jgi:fibronectin type 3 domain-containing protein
MKGLITVFAVLVVVGIAGFLYRTPTAPPEMTEAERAQIEAEVTEAATGLLDGFRTMDAEVVGEWFHPTETSFVWGGTINDRGGMIEHLRSFMEDFESWDGGWVETQVKVLTPDAAMFQGEFESTIHYTNGRVLRWPGNANFTMLMERTPEGWKVTIGDMDNGPSEVVEEG